MSEVVFHRLDRDGALRELRRYVSEELAPRPEVREVTLIGSLSRDDWSARSDADVVVLVDEAAGRGPLRGADYAPRTPLSISVDVLVYTPEEQAAWRARFRVEVEKGIGLYKRVAAA